VLFAGQPPAASNTSRSLAYISPPGLTIAWWTLLPQHYAWTPAWVHPSYLLPLPAARTYIAGYTPCAYSSYRTPALPLGKLSPRGARVATANVAVSPHGAYLLHTTVRTSFQDDAVPGRTVSKQPYRRTGLVCLNFRLRCAWWRYGCRRRLCHSGRVGIWLAAGHGRFAAHATPPPPPPHAARRVAWRSTTYLPPPPFTTTRRHKLTAAARAAHSATRTARTLRARYPHAGVLHGSTHCLHHHYLAPARLSISVVPFPS